jgi:hypothetical protein
VNLAQACQKLGENNFVETDKPFNNTSVHFFLVGGILCHSSPCSIPDDDKTRVYLPVLFEQLNEKNTHN